MSSPRCMCCGDSRWRCWMTSRGGGTTWASPWRTQRNWGESMLKQESITKIRYCLDILCLRNVAVHCTMQSSHVRVYPCLYAYSYSTVLYMYVCVYVDSPVYVHVRAYCSAAFLKVRRILCPSSQNKHLHTYVRMCMYIHTYVRTYAYVRTCINVVL